MDVLYKGVAFDNNISVTVIEATDMINEAIKIHNLSPLAAAALGRTMIASTFMASTIKSEGDRLSVTVSGNGVGGHIVVAGDALLNMRGYIDNPQCYLPLNAKGKLDVAGCVGKGRITVLKSMGLKEPYTGSAEIVSGELAEDFAAYYTYSEQQPTGMALGVKIGVDYKCIGAGGVIFQTLPNATEESIEKAERIILSLGDISTIMQNEGAESFVKRVFNDYSYEVYYPKYNCVCTKEYIDSMLITLGADELYATLKKEGKIEVNCHFCNSKYVYTEEDVVKLIKNATQKG